jgi:predicted dehydrogenase
MAKQLGVGFIGAGPVTQAIHMPVIASLGDRLRVVHVMDVERNVAEVVAARAGARASTDADSVLEDPDVDIVAVCSPHQFHTDQVLAAVAAGKRAVLCEKPLATTAEQAERLTSLCHRADVTVVVGAMHAYDPAYVAAQEHLLSSYGPPTLVRSVVYLPSNDEMTDLSTELVSAPARPGPPDSGPPDSGTPDSRLDFERELSVLRDGVLGLAIHDLPLIRRLVPFFDDVTLARSLKPWGYLLSLSSPTQVAQLIAVMPGHWGPSWTFSATGPGYELSVDFPPSYVLAGSATARLETESGTRVWTDKENGYQAEWRHLTDVALGLTEPRISLQGSLDDLLYALAVADGAGRHLVGTGGGQR